MLTSPEIINKPESEVYSVARLSKENLDDLALLHSEVYGVSRPAGYFFKKYNTAYTGLENVGFIAYSRNRRPVAYYGVIPCFLQSENEMMLVAQSADSMTHPRHRNKGMFNELSNRTVDLCRQLGIKLIFGFPNQNSYPTMVNRLGWIEADRMDRFIIPASTTFGRNFFRGNRERERILDKVILPKEALPNSVIQEGYIGLYRDKAYYGYKTFENTCAIKLSSADLWIKVKEDLIIGDVIVTGNSEDIFFDEIKALAKKLRVKKIVFQVSTNCRLHDLFAKRYEAIPSFPVLFKDFGSGLALEKIKFTFSDIDIF